MQTNNKSTYSEKYYSEKYHIYYYASIILLKPHVQIQNNTKKVIHIAQKHNNKLDQLHQYKSISRTR